MMLNSRIEMVPFQSDEVCPLCQNNRYLNPNMVLLLSTCFHKMCQSCVETTFKNGNAKCHACNKTLRRDDFKPQIFEDLSVEKEVLIRKRFSKIFNKRREDFTDLKSYNDYLELVEEYVMNLLYETDVEQTEAEVARYKEENKEVIRINHLKEVEEDRRYNRYIEEDRRLKTEGMQETLRLMKEEEEMRKQAENDIISNLANSNKSASEIINEQKKNKRKNLGMSAAELKAKSLRTRYDPRYDLNKNDEDEDTFYNPYEPIYAPIDIEMRRRYHDPICRPVLRNIEQLAAAGGYSVNSAYMRAIEAAHMAIDVDVPIKKN